MLDVGCWMSCKEVLQEVAAVDADAAGFSRAAAEPICDGGWDGRMPVAMRCRCLLFPFQVARAARFGGPGAVGLVWFGVRGAAVALPSCCVEVPLGSFAYYHPALHADPQLWEDGLGVLFI